MTELIITRGCTVENFVAVCVPRRTDMDPSESVAPLDVENLCFYVNELVRFKLAGEVLSPENVFQRAAIGSLLIDLVEEIPGCKVDRSRILIDDQINMPQRAYNVETALKAAQEFGLNVNGLNVSNVAAAKYKCILSYYC